jgi:hypothetical protein
MTVSGQLHLLHPQGGCGSLVPRLGHGQQRLLPILAEQGITTTVSPLHYMGHNRELALFALADPQLGLALDPMMHLRQVPPQWRGAAYRSQPFGNSPSFRPDSEALGVDEVVALAERPLDAQRVNGSTLMLTSSHVAGPVGSRSRQLDLLLARLGAEHFAAERMEQPAENAAVQVRRELFAMLTVESEALASPTVVEALARAYAELDVAGYWVKILGFWERAPRTELHGAGALLGALSDTGRAVVSCGPGGLHLPLLVADISTSIGLAESERFSVPDTRRERRSGPRPRMVYHPGYLRSFKAGGTPCTQAFACAPCRCGRHRKDRPPEHGAIDEHGALTRAAETSEALAGTPEERREWLRATAALASHLARDAGVDVVPFSTLEAVLGGVDAGRGERAEVG